MRSPQNIVMESRDLDRLHRTYVEVCNALDISDDDIRHREQVAQVVMDLARTGESDPGVLRARAVLRLRNSASALKNLVGSP